MLDHDPIGRSDPSFVDSLRFMARFGLRLRRERSFRANPSLPSRYAVFDPGSRHVVDGEVNNPTLDSRAAPEGFGSREVSFARPGNISSTTHQTLAAETISTHIGGLRGLRFTSDVPVPSYITHAPSGDPRMWRGDQTAEREIPLRKCHRYLTAMQ